MYPTLIRNIEYPKRKDMVQASINNMNIKEKRLETGQVSGYETGKVRFKEEEKIRLFFFEISWQTELSDELP